MYQCPHCATSSISTWRKLNATDVLPARCWACGGFYVITIIIGLWFDLKPIDSAQVVKARQRQKWLIFILAFYLLGVALFSNVFK